MLVVLTQETAEKGIDHARMSLSDPQKPQRLAALIGLPVQQSNSIMLSVWPDKRVEWLRYAIGAAWLRS